MRKALGYFLIFGIGFALCLVVLNASGRFRFASASEAQRNVLRILDQNTQGPPIPDNALVAAAGKIEPAVVNIDTLVTGQSQGDFFRPPRTFMMQGKGSGVIISPDGYVVTNNHVIEGANIIKVTMANQKQYDGRIIGADPDADIAVVKIDAADLPYAALGDSDTLKVGEYVLAIGYPLGVGTTVTHGIVSATDRQNLEVSEGRVLKHAIQTDAPINRGNSGGALADLNGKLIGINTAIYTENHGGNIGIGFAIPINAARSILKQLIATGKQEQKSGPSVPFLGIQYDPTAPLVEGDVKGEHLSGVRVTGVVPLTSAAAAGISAGDVIVAIDGTKLTGPADISRILSHHKVGEQTALSIVHTDETRASVKVTVGNRPTAL